MKRHLHLELSAHGFGHLAQTAPVVNALRARMPGLGVSVRTALPVSVLRERLHGDFEHIHDSDDVTMVMRSAVDVDEAASARAHLALHARRESVIAQLEKLYARLAPDLLLANIPYIPLIACMRARLPTVGLCSLDWGSVLSRYCMHIDGIEAVVRDMRYAYDSLSLFIRPAPSMPIDGMTTLRSVGPIARHGQCRRRELERIWPDIEGKRLALIALGGIHTELPLATWPTVEGVGWIANGPGRPRRDGWFDFDALRWPFIDVLASADVVLTKPGYGTYTEAACNGVRVLYAARPDWPEEPGLSRWVCANANAREVSREVLWQGRVEAAITELLTRPSRQPVRASGVEEAAALLHTMLAR